MTKTIEHNAWIVLALLRPLLCVLRVCLLDTFLGNADMRWISPRQRSRARYTKSKSRGRRGGEEGGRPASRASIYSSFSVPFICFASSLLPLLLAPGFWKSLTPVSALALAPIHINSRVRFPRLPGPDPNPRCGAGGNPVRKVRGPDCAGTVPVIHSFTQFRSRNLLNSAFTY